MVDMPHADAVTRNILLAIGSTTRSTRIARRWPQRRLATLAGVSQSLIARFEQARMPDLPLATAVRVLDALDIGVDLRLLAPRVATASQRDRAHARCVAYVARRLERAGFIVATEAEVGTERWRGFVDILGFDPSSHMLLVIEVKTAIDDVGAIDRQIGVYEQGAWQAAHARGWRPRAVTGVLLVLATKENDRRLEENRAHFDRVHRIRSRALLGLVERAVSEPPARGERGLAMVDPASRRRAWLLSTWLDGRRTNVRYEDRSDYLAPRTGAARRSAPGGRLSAARVADAAGRSSTR